MQCLHIQCVLSLMWTAEQIVRCVLSVFVYPGTENCEQIPSVGSPLRFNGHFPGEPGLAGVY